MASILDNNSLQINNTQEITGISTTLNNSNTEIFTSKAFIDFLKGKEILTVSKVGGIIFYINTSSTNNYTFYDASGTQVSAPSVGTDCTNWTYTKTGLGVDKFYVYYPTLVTSKYWGYYNITTSATGNFIGIGKTNTSAVLAITDTSQYASGSIWEYIRNMRTNNVNECDDWFVGCPAEYDKLRTSGTTGADWFSSRNIWSSCESTSTGAYHWHPDYDDPDEYGEAEWQSSHKGTQRTLIPIRAF